MLIRRSRNKPRISKQISGKSIEVRTAKVNDRNTFDHCEVDTVLGRKGRDEPVIFTLVEWLTDYCVFLHEKSKDGLPVVIFFYNPSKGPDDDLWYVSAYILSNGVFMGSEGILDSSERIDRRFESIKKWA